MRNSLANGYTVEWVTPQDLFDSLNEQYRFTLDPCASPDNAKCARYFTVNQNGLTQSWAGERVFMNPPYGREVGKWMRKAFEEGGRGTLVVCLVPSRTDTAWWHDYVMRGRVVFLRGRLKYPGGKYNAPFASAIVIFGEVSA